ncbi:sugar-transfer associated ATP-grasp domain-containing protein [Microcella frigidaquae]|uniref:Alpha-L-glutamate ligase-related protein ATP-grasp domain-containing protein n=1 Tax=Microcella frigidaquae TaxID=424758 RepID=A0A840X5X2_9MICO|nr:sugar-transfer associated ATP-grasp domain-containing protein [Microcella frigidaquae]MBB5616614.1 hypothetical protein [Microcella frigidaquae]NHN43944.1 hypothetical protein [Microcella frigidaquae]
MGRLDAARRRLRYLAGRARAFNPDNLTRIATRVADRSGRSRTLIIIDMLWSSVRHEVNFQDYAEWDFHTLSRRERATYMTSAKSNHLSQRWNAASHRQLFADKAQFCARFAAHLGREVIDLRAASADELAGFLARHPRVVAKVADSLGGDGIEVYASAEVGDPEAFRAARLAGRQVLLEEFLTQHPAMAALNPTSVNTLRVVTFLGDDGTVHRLVRVLRIGNGGDVDNFKAGGMYTVLDENGVAQHPAIDGDDRVFEAHPLSGTPIVGFRVPNWDALETLVDAVAREVPEIRYVGWDFAVTPMGAAVIEGNYNTGVFQLKPSVTGVREGLLPLYRSVIGF